MKNIIPKLHFMLIELIVGKTPVVFNTEIIDGKLQYRHNGFYKEVFFS